MKKLNLNKETIAALDNRTMSEIKGGFTYSLSGGAVCKLSRKSGAQSAYECGLKQNKQELNPSKG